MILIKTVITLVLSLALSLPLMAQNIAAFSGTKTPETASIANITSEALTRGPGLTVGGGTTFNSGNWETGKKLDTNNYIQWSVTAAAGYIINITELQINFDRDPDGFSHFFTGNGPAQIRIRTSLDNYKSDLYSNDKVSNSGESPTIETALNSASGGNITFRLYGFSANIGMLGPLGTFDIEGGLGTVLGLTNTGIRLVGDVTYDGLLFSDGNWTPKAPDARTSDENVLIVNGTYTETKNVQVKNLKVQSGADIYIQKTGSITVNGDLHTSNSLTLLSDSDHYSSLIVTGAVIGTAKYKRQMKTTAPMGVANNEVLISAPVIGETFKGFRAANPNIVSNTANSLFLFGPFDKTKGNYTLYSNSEKETFTAATGYKAAATNTKGFTFAGTVNTEAVKKKIENSGRTYAEWNLIGNPYPSYINLSEFLATNNPEFEPSSTGIYVYDTEASDGWTVQNLAYLTVHPDAKIRPGQGFMVAAKTGGATVSFQPTMRSLAKPDEFSVGKRPVEKNIGFFKLNLTNGILNYNTEFYFNDQSTKGLDPGYDAGIYGDNAPDFAIYSHLVEHNTGLEMAVQSLSYSDLENDITIPLGLHAAAGQQITVSISDVILPEDIDVYLEDTLTGTYTLLSTSNYNAFVKSKISETGRFFLHLVNSSLSYGSNGRNNLQLYTTDASGTLHIKGTIEPNTIITVYDLQGRIMISNQFEEYSKNNQIDLSILSSGMYLVKLRAGSLEKIKKIMMK